jgi:hypothetical protein
MAIVAQMRAEEETAQGESNRRMELTTGDRETHDTLIQMNGFFGGLLELLPKIFNEIKRLEIRWEFATTASAGQPEENEQFRAKVKDLHTRLVILTHGLEPVKRLLEKAERQ